MHELKTKEYVLERFKEVFQYSISPEDYEALQFDMSQKGRYLVLRIQQDFFGEKKQDTVPIEFTFRTPATWWQHFKQENFPAWLLRRYPVRYRYENQAKTVEINRTFIFPEAFKSGHSILGKFYIRDTHQVLDLRGNKSDKPVDTDSTIKK